MLLFDRILQGKYPADTWLKEDALAEEFNVSRTPIRQILRQLEQDGLIEIILKRGARIFPFTADDIEEIFEIRQSLEILALEMSAPTLKINDLMEIRGKIENIAQTQDSKKHTDMDEMFHKYYIETSRKKRLISMLHQLYRLIQRFRELGFRNSEVRKLATREHLAILDALCLRDVVQAKQLLENHLQQSKTRLISILINRHLA